MISISSRRAVLNVSLRCKNGMKSTFLLLHPTNMHGLRAFSSLPYHLVVGMPALSPTMDAGTISAWNVKEGDSFIAGDSLAEIETDKASIAFEAQDDGVVAKLLVEAGSGEIKVGTPIMVTVEDEESVAAFQNFVPEASIDSAPKPKEEKPVAAAPPPVVSVSATPTPPPLAVAPAPAAAVPSPKSSQPPAAVSVAPVVPSAISSAPTVGPSWGSFAKIRSPLAAALSKDQKKYVEIYGSTGQLPL